MAAITILRATLVGVLGVAEMTDLINLPMLYVIFFLITTGETLFDTSAAAILPAIVTADELPKANARLSGTVSVANQFAGLPLGGLLFSLAAALPFLLGSAGLVVSVVLLIGLRGSFTPKRAEDAPPGDMRREIVEGLRWLWRHTLLRTTAVALGILNFTLVAQISIMVLFAEERLSLSPAGYGLLLTAYGIGGVLGSVVAGFVLRRVGNGTYLRVAVVVETVIPIAIVLSGNPFLVGFVLVLFGVNGTIWGVVLVSIRQQLTPDRLRGRVQSAYGLIENGTAAPATIVGGLLAARFGLAAPFWFAGVVGMILLPLVWSTFSNAAVVAARGEAEMEET